MRTPVTTIRAFTYEVTVESYDVAQQNVRVLFTKYQVNKKTSYKNPHKKCFLHVSNEPVRTSHIIVTTKREGHLKTHGGKTFIKRRLRSIVKLRQKNTHPPKYPSKVFLFPCHKTIHKKPPYVRVGQPVKKYNIM